MHDGALLLRQFNKRAGQLIAEKFFIGIARWRERRNDFGGEIFLRPVARAAPAHQINRRVVRQPDEKGAFLADTGKQFRFARELDENFLKQVARVGLVAGEIQ